MYDRSKTIGASDAPYIAEGRWLELYQLKKNPSPDVLSDVLPVQIGKCTEQLNLDWFERHMDTQLVRYDSEYDPPLQHPDHDWMVCIPDATMTVTRNELDELIDGYAVPVEAKHVNQFWLPRNLIAKYTPQLLHQMMILGADHGYLSVIYGNGLKYEYYRIDYDDIAAYELLRQEELFMWFLNNDQPPPE